ncbi:hypothetical protein BN126_2552 [Cronobacter sakazakii 680]|nr:hypothetical protein BN126_2552 [Cronobacter sakazakii 680]
MTRHFTQHRAIAAADDQHALRVAVGQQRHMRHHFVIDKFIAFGGLHHAVQRHHPAKGGVFENNQILMIGFFAIEHFVDGKVLTKLIVQRFVPHRILGHGLIPPSLTPHKNGRNIIANYDRGCTVTISPKERGRGLLHVGKQA